jgi:predicted nucleotidyltransferase
MRSTLEKIVAEMRTAENISGVGLFGSWSRGDAAASSDVDLLILMENSVSHEYVERIKRGNLLIDLDYIPKSWIKGPIPPEIDQKIYETQILYDRYWSMSNMKLSMSKCYASTERIKMRTESHIVESDICLSRATSDLSRGDFSSAYLFAVIALENMLKVLLEVTLKPFSNSRFLEQLKDSAMKLGMQDFFNAYLTMCGLDKLDQADVRAKLQLFKLIWEEMNETIQRNSRVFESFHFKVRMKLKYYLNPIFLQGVMLRTNSLLDFDKTAEALHYLRNILFSIIENYVWFKSSIVKVRAGYATFTRSLRMLEAKNPKFYEYVLELLGLCDVDKYEAARATERAREMILKIRRDSKILIGRTY